MFPKSFKKIRTQLILWYAAVFIISYAALFALARLALSSSLQKQDQEFVRSVLEEYALRYKTDGMPEMLKEIELEKSGDRYRQTITRVADPNNRTLYLSEPPLWHRYDLNSLANTAPKNVAEWIRLPKPNDEDRLEVASVLLDNGNILQVGVDSGERNDSLESFSNLFSPVPS